MTTYASSNNITVFPISQNRSADPSARILTESNLLKLVKGLTDFDSFVISKTIPTNADKFEFVLHGYYICIKNFSTVKMANNDTYAYITVSYDSSATSDAYEHLLGTDTESAGSTNFQGVMFDSQLPLMDPVGTKLYGLKLVSYADGRYSIPEESQIKLSLRSLEIDGGELD